jgi:hypothetical protein
MVNAFYVVEIYNDDVDEHAGYDRQKGGRSYERYGRK